MIGQMNAVVFPLLGLLFGFLKRMAVTALASPGAAPSSLVSRNCISCPLLFFKRLVGLIDKVTVAVVVLKHLMAVML